MHHAARGHENPALDAALSAGNALSLPVLVYQGLSAKLPYASDRHFAFILEGARDVGRELEGRGVAHAFCLAPRQGDREPLLHLASRAALVVVEDFPAPPWPRWTAKLAAVAPAPVWAVDSCCVVPMQLPGKAFERAFQFRRAVRGELDRRVGEPWREVEPKVEPFAGDLGFEAVDLAEADVPELCAGCEIDHAVGPVPHTRGGSAAGYRRWRAFVESGGLKHYARRRNDAAIDGVSRLYPTCTTATSPPSASPAKPPPRARTREEVPRGAPDLARGGAQLLLPRGRSRAPRRPPRLGPRDPRAARRRRARGRLLLPDRGGPAHAAAGVAARRRAAAGLAGRAVVGEGGAGQIVDVGDRSRAGQIVHDDPAGEGRQL